jgi:hypothetical protein
MQKAFIIFLITLLSLLSSQFKQAYSITRGGDFLLVQSETSSAFDILRNQDSNQDERNISIFSYKPTQNEFKTYIYFVFIFLFIILIIIKLTSPEYFPDLFSSLWNTNYLLSRISKSKFNISLNSIFLDFIFFVTISYFFYQYLYSVYEIDYYLIFGGILGFTFIQMLLVIITYNLFFGSVAINVHLSNILISNRIIGIIFVPLLFIITYINHSYQAIGLNILLVILVGIVILRTYRIINQLKIINNFSFLFRFVYICTFELSVYFVCFKAVLLIINS